MVLYACAAPCLLLKWSWQNKQTQYGQVAFFFFSFKYINTRWAIKHKIATSSFFFFLAKLPITSFKSKEKLLEKKTKKPPKQNEVSVQEITGK